MARAYSPPLDLTARALNPCDSGGRRSQKAPVNADQTPGQRASNPPESLKRARNPFFIALQALKPSIAISAAVCAKRRMHSVFIAYLIGIHYFYRSSAACKASSTAG